MQDQSYTVEVNGKQYQLTKYNVLTDMNAWDADILSWLAQDSGITLNKEHHAVLTYVRKNWAERQRHPIARLVASHLADEYGEEKGTKHHFYSLFPLGVAQAGKLAGIPMQGLCF